MKKPIFVPSDFKSTPTKLGFSSFGDASAAADIANAKIEKMISEAPVVYLDKEINGWHASEATNKGKTHTARLLFVEEIVKEPCKHEPIIINHNFATGITLSPGKIAFEYFDHIECKLCGVVMKATWTAK